MDKLRDQLKVLSKRHSLEMISILLDGPRYISQISGELGIPYTTVQQRVAELERAGFIEVAPSIDEASKRAIKEVRLINFRIELSPRVIHALLMGEEKRDLRVG